jgi:alanine-glyoxylate transaminase/serine-glyoxylate transaminase/serine-pyruvate transaminase
MTGRTFVQIPGPTNIPERVQRAMHRPMVDHRGQAFAGFTKALLPRVRQLFRSEQGTPLLFPSSGTGALESALVNLFSPGDKLLAYNIGQFSAGTVNMAQQLGLHVEEVVLPWGSAINPDALHAVLAADTGHSIAGVLTIHNETATGVTNDIAGIRQAMERAGHPALLMVDTVSGVGCIDFRFDAWGVDVAVTGSQKGLMLPPGLGVLCVGDRALRAAGQSRTHKSYFDWAPHLLLNRQGYFPYTPPTSLLYGLAESLDMLFEEGLEHVHARHARLAEGVRRAVKAWGLSLLAIQPERASNVVSTVKLPEGIDGAALLAHAETRLGLSLGAGLGPVAGKAFRIGHLGALNELEVLATLGGIEMALHHAGVKLSLGSGVRAAQEWFLSEA